jgi:phosphoenolpyruvate carboxylase
MDPLNYIQVMLLRKHRNPAFSHDEEIFDPLLRTIHAIAAGLRNTG